MSVNQNSMGIESIGMGRAEAWPESAERAREGSEQRGDGSVWRGSGSERDAIYRKLDEIVSASGYKILPGWRRAGRDTAIILALVVPWIVAAQQFDMATGAVLVAGGAALAMALDGLRRIWNKRVDERRAAALQALTHREQRLALEGVDRLRWVWMGGAGAEEVGPPGRSFSRSRKAGRWEEGVPQSIAALVRELFGPSGGGRLTTRAKR